MTAIAKTDGLTEEHKEYLRNLAYYSTKWFFIWSFRLAIIGFLAIAAIAIFIGMSCDKANSKKD